MFPFTQTRKQSTNAWVNVCMESDHSHTAYRIRMPQPQAAYAYRVWNPSLMRVLKVKLKVEHTDSKCDFLKKSKIYRLILCNVFFKMTHVLPLVSAQNCDKNALQNRRGRPALNKIGSTIVFCVQFCQNLSMYSIFAESYLQKY